MFRCIGLIAGFTQKYSRPETVLQPAESLAKIPISGPTVIQFITSDMRATGAECSCDWPIRKFPREEIRRR
jgi:hypothetical protein